MEVLTQSAEETGNLAANIVKKLLQNESESATVVGLCGELGSGKTTFMKGIASALGVKETIVSPTFVIEKIYKLENSKFDHLIHFDAYRIEKSDELLHLGWNEMISNPKNLIFVEWPERVIDIMPENHKKIEFHHSDENKRTIIF